MVRRLPMHVDTQINSSYQSLYIYFSLSREKLIRHHFLNFNDSHASLRIERVVKNISVRCEIDFLFGVKCETRIVICQMALSHDLSQLALA